MIHFEARDAVAVLTLDNGTLNILTREMHRLLFESLQRFLRDDSLKVAVLTCKPGASFSAGDDLKSMDEDLGQELDWETLAMQVHRTKPIVGAVREHCLGQGLLYLLLHTDIRVASPSARFGFPEIRHGMGGAAVVSQLALQVPHTVAMQMTLTGESIAADQALACHLINRIVPDEELLDNALSLARAIARHDLSALRVEMVAASRNRQLGPAETMALAELLWQDRRPSSKA
ncbi:MAG: enoyl-CoA hydratase/isomerase family protein [Zoogloea sp.]|nr:enoyl-CoA hydratase/isomerase family protein [Zoogloea sp.]